MRLWQAVRPSSQTRSRQQRRRQQQPAGDPAHREGDPHLTLAHGGEADFRGCDDCLFNFLSTDDLVVNARTKDATFRRLSNATTNKQQRASIQPEEGTWQAPPSTGWL